MNKVFREIGTSITLPISTIAVRREETFVQEVDKYLYDSNGNRLSLDALKKLGLEVLITPDQTPEYIEYHQFVPLFQVNADMEPRVLEYKAFFDELGIPYNSKTDGMKAGIERFFPNNNDEDELATMTRRNDYYARMNTALTNVKVNYQVSVAQLNAMSQAEDSEPMYPDANDFITWFHTPLLIKYMPLSKPVEPEFLEPYVATEETEAAEAAAIEEASAALIDEAPETIEE